MIIIEEIWEEYLNFIKEYLVNLFQNIHLILKIYLYIYSILECEGYNPPSLFAEIHETNNHLFGISDKHQTNCIL